MEDAKAPPYRQGDGRGRDHGMGRIDGDRYESRGGYERFEDRPRGRNAGPRDYDMERGRRSERSPSPIPDFGNKSIRWSGWDKPVPRYGTVAPVASGGWANGGREGFDGSRDGNSAPFDAQRGAGGAAIPRQLKRLYVGNLPSRLSEPHFVDFLNTSMKKVPQILLGEGNPIIGIDMSSERTYCFIEFRTPDEATYFTAFDGLSYEGHSLRVHRPREWAPTGTEPPLPHIPPSVLGIVSTTVADGPNKIFIGGLPTHFNEAEVKDIFSALGALKSFNLVRDNNGNSKGFAFCEYMDPDITDVVCQSFNGRRYGDRVLVVQRSQPNQKGGPGSGMAGGMGGNGMMVDDGNRGGRPGEFGGAPVGPGIVVQQRMPSIIVGSDGVSVLDPEESKSPQGLLEHLLNTSVPTDVLTNTIVAKAKDQVDVLQPTPILVLLNALDISEEWTDAYYEAVCQDMWNEASKFGTVVRLEVPRAAPKPKKRRVLLMPGELSESDVGAESKAAKEAAEKAANPPPPPGVGRVYIQFESIDNARAALTGMAGRRYDGRMLLSSFVKSFPGAA